MRHIEISASEKLLEYMDRKGYHCIAVEPISPKGCCADMTELHSRFVRDKDVPRLKARNCGVFEAPFGEMLVLEKGLEIEAYRTKSVSHLGASAQVDAPFSFV